MTLSKRLLILMATSVAALLVVAVLALIQMGRVYDKANYGNENTVPSIIVLNRAMEEFSHIRVRLYRHVLNEDDKVKADLDAKINEARDGVEKALKEYETLVSSDEDKKLLETDRNDFAAYAQAIKSVQEMSRAKQHDEALKELTAGATVAENFNSALIEHIKFNHELGDKQADEAVAAKRSATWLSVIIALIALGLVGGMGLQIRASLSSRLREANLIAERVASGDLSSRGGRVDGNDEVGQLMKSMEKMRADLASTVKQIISSTDQLVDSSNHLSSAAQQVSDSTQTQSNSTSSAAAAVEELTVSIDHVGQNADEASNRAREAGDLALESGKSVAAAAGEINQVVDSVENTARQMHELAEQVQQIGNITTVIREVADQTNLLALNAAIEAARAGEQGRGFAVVADEVRKLAERTTVSVQEIGAVISTIQNGVSSAVDSMQASRSLVGNVVTATNSASTSMENIRAATETVQIAIAEISDALREQRSASTELARNVESVAQMSEENSASVSSVADTAHRLAAVSGDLKSSASRFRL